MSCNTPVRWTAGNDLAADRDGRVFVVFHAQLPGAKSEAERAIWIAASANDGHTFADEKNALPEPTGVCACCALVSTVDVNGALAILYRGATESVERGMHLLVSHDHAATFVHTKLDEWKLTTCPMSSAALLPATGAFLSVWENAGRIRIAGEKSAGEWATESGEGQKLPVIARQEKTGEMLVAWTEGMGWTKGGALAWRYINPAKPSANTTGRQDGVPANGSLAAVALPTGKFAIFY